MFTDEGSNHLIYYCASVLSMKRNKNDYSSEAGLVACAPRSVASGGWPVQDPGHVSYGAEEEAVKHERMLASVFLHGPQNPMSMGGSSSVAWPCGPVLRMKMRSGVEPLQ